MSKLAETVTLMGLGSFKQGSGMSAAKFLIGRCDRLIITDLKNVKALERQVRDIKKFSVRAKSRTRLVWRLGGHREEDFIKTDLVVRNPDVPWYSLRLEIAREHDVPIFNDVTLFMWIFSPELVIGVTGTRGKSTTAALIYEMMRREQPATKLAGNIGQSPLACLGDFCHSEPKAKNPYGEFIEPSGILRCAQDDIGPLVLELSSFLLHDFSQISYSPNISVWTNFYPDHLNKYHGLKDYFADKFNIFRYQKAGDMAVLNADDPSLRAVKIRKAKTYYFSLKKRVTRGALVDRGWFVFRDGGRTEKIARVSDAKLLGAHNQANILAAICAAKAAGISSTVIARVIKEWRGLPNRLELVRESSGGVKWFNDCTATSPEAAIAALRSFPARRVILISGGNSKGSDLSELAKTIRERVKELVLVPGESSNVIASLASRRGEAIPSVLDRHAPLNSARDDSGRLVITPVPTLAAAVSRARLAAGRGDVVLFSPGLTWLPLLNEFARGEKFVKLVNDLIG